MRNAFPPAIPTRAAKVPDGPDWIHEIKHDGFRLIVVRDDTCVRLFTKSGHDWTGRYPWIAESALKIRRRHFVIDGEAVVLGVDGVSDFDALHSRKHDEEVRLYAFDCLALDGIDLRDLPLFTRKKRLAQLLGRRPEGIFVAHFEQGESGPELFRHACRMGLEGFVSKHRERRYRAGPCDHWLKVKNPKHPSIKRVKETFA
jgi:bifunctional non-homologous end joining protein LigD